MTFHCAEIHEKLDVDNTVEDLTTYRKR